MRLSTALLVLVLAAVFMTVPAPSHESAIYPAPYHVTYHPLAYNAW